MRKSIATDGIMTDIPHAPEDEEDYEDDTEF